jgi:hypothetical protein
MASCFCSVNVEPVSSTKPSYYPVVALEKVGLDGQLLRTHKIRTMFPFSEFLQKRVFDEHGLAPAESSGTTSGDGVRESPSQILAGRATTALRLAARRHQAGGYPRDE